MNILLVASTALELDPVLSVLNPHNQFAFSYKYQSHTVSVLTSGVGSINTSFALARYKINNKLDLAIQLGLAGSFSKNIAIGDVVTVDKDRFGDLGSEDVDGSLLDVYENNLAKPDSFPFSNGWIYAHKPPSLELKSTVAITVNTCSGNEMTIKNRFSKYHPDIESMEGAAFYYVCNMLDIPCIQIRSISNYVEPRNTSDWDINLAINNLSNTFFKILDQLR
jgi:futalosine hydrolase